MHETKPLINSTADLPPVVNPPAGGLINSPRSLPPADPPLDIAHRGLINNPPG
jgi:hypothetical protein